MVEREAGTATGGVAEGKKVSTASDSSNPASFDDLCRRHGQLLEAQADERLDGDAAAVFVADAAAAGVQIESVSDRDAIRSMLNYWTGTLARIPAAPSSAKAGSAPPPEIERPSLASFDASKSPDLDEKDNPFVGLAAFDVGQSEVFFGRDKVVADLLDLVCKNQLVVVSGASGTGKSSLVRAGLTGAVRADPQLANWTIAVSVPGRDPIASLIASLAPQGQAMGEWVDAARARLDGEPATAGDLAAERIGDGELLLIVDQLEEVISLCPADVRDDAARAIAAIAALPRAHVVVTIRDEYLERESTQRELPALDLAKAVEFRIPPLDSNEIRAAISEPAARAGLVFHDGLIDQIVAEVGTDPAALPLLQYALLQMWRKRQGNRITLAVYEEVGGPATALSKAAQHIYDGFVEQTQHQTQVIFQQLVRPSLVYEYVRDRVKRVELERLIPSANIKTVIKPFVEAGLMHVTYSPDSGEDRIEIAHEALIRNWDLLRRWAAEVRDRERLFLEIDAQAERWDEAGNSFGHLLFGKALRDAEEAQKQYRSRARVDPVANARVERYLGASRTKQRRLLSGLVSIAVIGLLMLGGFLFSTSKYFTEAENFRNASKIIDVQDTELKAKAGESAADDDAALQFIQMLLTRGDIDTEALPPQFADMTPLAAPLSMQDWPTPFDDRFLSPFEIMPTVVGRSIIPLRLPNLRVFYDTQMGVTRLAISQSDRSAQASANRPNALYRWPGLAEQLDQRELAEEGMVLARLVDPREVAWGPQGDRAARAVNLLPLMIPIRLQGSDPVQLRNWSALGASLRSRHNPVARQVMYFSGAVPSFRGAPPRMLWKVAVSIDEAERLTADALTLPAKGASRNRSVIGTLNFISAASGVDFSKLKKALEASGTANPVTADAPVQAPISATASLINVYIQVQGISDVQATAIRLALAGQGLRTPPIQQVDQCLQPAQLRYYYPQDAEAAANVARLAGTVIVEAGLGDGEVRVVQLNLKRFPKARPGNLELWICGSSGPKRK